MTRPNRHTGESRYPVVLRRGASPVPARPEGTRRVAPHAQVPSPSGGRLGWGSAPPLPLTPTPSFPRRREPPPLRRPFALSLSKGLPRARYGGPHSPSRHSCEGRNPEARGRGASPLPFPLTPTPSFPRRREPPPLRRPFTLTPTPSFPRRREPPPLHRPFALTPTPSFPRRREPPPLRRPFALTPTPSFPRRREPPPLHRPFALTPTPSFPRRREPPPPRRPFALTPTPSFPRRREPPPLRRPFTLTLPRTRYGGPRSPSRHSCEGRNPEARGRGAPPPPFALTPTPSFPRRREPPPPRRPFTLTPTPSFPRRREPPPPRRPFALTPTPSFPRRREPPPLRRPFTLTLPRTRYGGPRSPSRHSCEGRNPEVRGRVASPLPFPLTPTPSFPRRREPPPLRRPFALSLSKGLPRTRYGGPKPTAVNA